MEFVMSIGMFVIGSAVGSQVLERILLFIGRILMIFGGIFTLILWFGSQTSK